MEETRTEQPIVQSVSSVGALLREAREARGLSVEEIAERVKFSVRQIEALEHDDMEHLPQGTFLRGFIRSYARVLGMDETKLLEAPHTQTEHHFDVVDVQAGGAPLPITGDASRRSRYLLLGALVVAILLAGFLLTHQEDIPLLQPVKVTEEAVLEPASGVSAEPVVAEAPEKLADARSIAPKETQKPEPVTKKPEAPKPVFVVKPVEPAKVAVTPKPPVAPAPKVASPQPEASKPASASTPESDSETSASSTPEVPLAQLMKRPIHIVYLEDAWMEIIDVNGEILLSRVTKAGEEKWIGGRHRAPYNVTIGRPAAVRMYYHGKQVDLSQFNPASVAKLVLE